MTKFAAQVLTLPKRIRGLKGIFVRGEAPKRSFFLLLIGMPACFTLLVAWFAWSALQAAPSIAIENLRGAGLSIAAAIEQLAAADPSFRSLTRYSTPDIAYFALVDQEGVVRFHTNASLIGVPFTGTKPPTMPDGITEQRELLGTGEEVYLLRTKIHLDQGQDLLVLALHTFRADQVIRRARTGATIVMLLTMALWVLTGLLFFMFRREDRHRHDMRRQEELARLGEMGAVMAHEIRNPLAGIKGFAQLVETAASLDLARSYAATIVGQSLRMEALVNDLLAFARSDQGKRQQAELSTLIEECTTLLLPEAAAHHVQIETDLPRVKTAVVVDRVVQMLLNLMKNAIQAMPEGGVMKIELRLKGTAASITVSDTGAGIAAEHLPRIFEPFWTNKTTGTGLGLALCRKVAEEHGGTLTVTSDIGIGSAFIASLPVAQ